MLTWKSTLPLETTQVVLIVTDQNDRLIMWESLLNERGYITVQETYDNALQTCQLIAPALIVIDTNLPHSKRLVLCSQLREIVSAPILLLVSDYNGGQMVDMYNIGVDECLLKPVSSAFLVVKATSWLFRHRWPENISRPHQFT